jgi:hypothetical protein
MNSTAANLVRRINQFLGGGHPQWNGSSKRLAVEYTELVDRLSQRFSLAQLQLDLEDYEEARAALHLPEPLLVEIRGLQFPRRLEWEKLVRSHEGPFRKLVSLDDVLRLEQQLQSKGPGKPGPLKRQRNQEPVPGGRPANPLAQFAKDPDTAARQLASVAGFADARSPASIRMIPFVVAILAVGLALFLLAVVGPRFLAKQAADQDAGMGAEELANLKDKPAVNKNLPGEVAFGPRENAGEPGKGDANLQENGRPLKKAGEKAGGFAKQDDQKIVPEKGDPADKKNPIEPQQVAQGQGANEKAGKKELSPDEMKKGAGLKKAANLPEAPLPPGKVRGPEILALGEMIDAYAQEDSGGKLKTWLQLEEDTADKAAVNGLLDFIRADFGLVGRKPPLQWKDLPEWIESGRSLNRVPAELFHPEKLKSMLKSGKQAEADLVDWCNKMIVADLKPTRFFSDAPRVVYPEALFSFAANVDLVDEFTKFIDRKMIEYDGGRPKKVKPFMVVILKEKRDLKNMSNDDLLTSLVAINTELKRRVRSAHYPWKTSPP